MIKLIQNCKCTFIDKLFGEQSRLFYNIQKASLTINFGLKVFTANKRHAFFLFYSS